MMNCATDVTHLGATDLMPVHGSTFRGDRRSRARLRGVHLRDQLWIAQADLQRELKIVGEIQQSLLPATLPDIRGFDVASFYQPSAHAGGDYFDVVPLAGGKWGSSSPTWPATAPRPRSSWR